MDLLTTEQLLAKAAKKGNGFGTFMAKANGTSSDRKEEAAELYREAANRLIAAKNFSGAGSALAKAAKVDSRPYDSASSMVDAAHAYRTANQNEDAINLMGKAISIFIKRGPQRRAAQLMLELAELYQEIEQWQDAKKTWNAAVNASKSMNAPAMVAKASLGLANAGVKTGDYDIAIKGFEAAAEDAKTNRLARWSLKSYYFKAGLCYLAAEDDIGCMDALDTYCKQDKAFNATPEFKCLKNLIKALEINDEPMVEKAIFDYDRQNRMDKELIELGLKIKARVHSIL